MDGKAIGISAVEYSFMEKGSGPFRNFLIIREIIKHHSIGMNSSYVLYFIPVI